ncbi:MAG: DUF1573 domain-containing protein [Candidatus Omnitrophota bacterium]|jgi:cytochrome c biogenesis protein CcdA
MIKKILIALWFLMALALPAYCAEEADTGELIYFYSLTCDKCIEIKENVMPRLEDRFKDDLRVLYKEIGDIENYKSLFELKSKYSQDEKVVFPVLFLNGFFIDRRDLESGDPYEKIASFISSSMKGAGAAPAASEPIDPAEKFKTFTLPAILAAGFVDGINPCSFTVLVFFISFISVQRYSKKAVIAAGCAFILASFFTYLAIGLGLFGSLHALKGYRAVTGIVTVIVGALSVLLGAISLYDAFVFLKTRRPEDSILKLPGRIKERIHKLVGDGYRAHGSPDAGRSVLRIFLASLAIGFSISILESVCTGQLYLPTIIFVLKTASYKLQALFYLLTYNIMFILPLIAIFLLALAGVSSQAFASIFKKYFFMVKVLLALLFLALGASLVFAEGDAPVKKIGSKLEPKTISSPPTPKRPNDPFYWDFGKVKEGAVLKHRFLIVNDTKDPFKIKQINTSCACAVSTVEKDVIQPGEKVPIYTEFKTKGYPGERTRYTYVHTDSKRSGIIVFEIRAEVIKEKN